jgi:xanthine dehydrogenase molybdenum-binding subunit
MSMAELLLERKPEYSVIGKPVSKVDGDIKVTGAARYVDDVKLPNLLYAKVLRSPYPHARIRKIDVSGALRVPGVVAVVTAYDFKLGRLGILQDHPPLKGDEVRSVRDEVAAVAAIDEETAERALEEITVEYEELPAVFDPIEAMGEGAPLVHEELGTNVAPIRFTFYSHQPEEIEGVFERARAVAEGEFRTQYTNASPLGTMGVVAHYDPAGYLTVYTNTQAPFLYRRDLARVLGMDPMRIRVVQTEIGGSFGRGMDLYPPDVIACLLSIKARAPVRLVYTRQEELMYEPPRQPVIVRMRTAADRDGRLLAREAKVVLDAGPYVSWGPYDGRVMMVTTTSMYNVPHVAFDAKVVYTNNPYTGTQRGAGNPQITFAIEQQMDELAEELGIDPVEFKILNANRPNTVTPQGIKITTCAMAEAIRKAAELIGWRGRGSLGPNRGIGMACYFHVGGGARIYRSDGCGAIIVADDFGQISLVTGSTDIGTGSDTALAQIVAEVLGVPVGWVRVVNDVDTSFRPWDVGTHASRATFIAGNAALMAAREARRVLVEGAAEVLGVDEEDVELKDGFAFSRRDPSKRIEIPKLIRRIHFREKGNVILATAFYDPPNEMQDDRWYGNISATYTFGCQAVQVRVDPETMQVFVERVVSVHDVGRVLNPLTAEGQVHGGVAMGLGLSLFEELVMERGAVVNSTLMDYMLPTAMEVPPEIQAVFVGEDDPEGPFGAKGLGETGTVPTAAAVANAIYDAIGVRPRRTPITPEYLWRLKRGGSK